MSNDQIFTKKRALPPACTQHTFLFLLSSSLILHSIHTVCKRKIVETTCTFLRSCCNRTLLFSSTFIKRICDTYYIFTYKHKTHTNTQKHTYTNTHRDRNTSAPTDSLPRTYISCSLFHTHTRKDVSFGVMRAFSTHSRAFNTHSRSCSSEKRNTCEHEYMKCTDVVNATHTHTHCRQHPVDLCALSSKIIFASLPTC